jgi:methionyl aminopeptidase
MNADAQAASAMETSALINLKTPAEIELIRASGRIASQTLDFLAEYARPGVTTEELNRLGHDFMVEQGAAPSTLGYRGYPKSMCISINEVVVHGIPGPRKLREGDIVTIDVTAYKNGFHGDTARTFLVGQVSPRARRLVDTTQESMDLAIQICRVGGHLGDIGAVVQSRVEAEGFSVVRAFVGHGIGRNFHEDPQVPYYGRSGTGVRLKEGMVLTIEPMINEGTWEVITQEDGWTAVTKDGLLSAQFEHTVAITENGPDILTLS